MSKFTLDVKELAALLGVSITTVYSMARTNEIPHSRIRGRIIFHYPTIEQWLINGAPKNYREEVTP